MSQHKDKRKEVGWDVLQAGTGASQPALRPTAQADGLLCGSQPALTVKEQKRGRRPTRTVFDRNKIESPTRWKNERPNHEQFRENPMPSLLKSVPRPLGRAGVLKKWKPLKILYFGRKKEPEAINKQKNTLSERAASYFFATEAAEVKRAG